MALVEYVPDDVYTSILGSNQTANLLRAIFNSPPWAEAFVKLGVIQMTQLELSPDDREIIILRTGANYAAPYIEGMHEGAAIQHGVTALQVSELTNKDYNPEVFSVKQRHLLSLVDMLCGRKGLDRDCILDARKYYSDRQIVEIIGVHGFTYSVAKITTVLDVELDRSLIDGREDFIAKVGAR